MNLSNEFVNQLALYFGGKLSLAELREWEVKMFLKRNNLTSDDRKFLFEFERHYGEMSVGLPETTFKSMIRSLVNPVVVEVPASTHTETTLLYSPQTGSTSPVNSLNRTGATPNMVELIPA